MSSTPTPGPYRQNPIDLAVVCGPNAFGVVCAGRSAAKYLANHLNALASQAAAAPDLLAACKAALQELATIDHACSLGMMETNPAVKQLRAALAKAEGGAE